MLATTIPDPTPSHSEATPRVPRATLPALARAILDLVAPRRCGGCGALLVPSDRSPFCDACAPSVLKVADACLRCALPARQMSCASCAGLALPFATARARFLYGGQLAVAVQALKYRGSGHLAGPLGRCLGQEVLEGPSIDLIVPVPLHRRRLALRGYNQAALLARAAARTAQLPCYPVALQRTRDTASQAWLGIEERRQNVHGAFRATCPRRVAGQSVLLIDDVMTTGSTAAAAATALLEAGATEVHVLTLARAMP